MVVVVVTALALRPELPPIITISISNSNSLGDGANTARTPSRSRSSMAPAGQANLEARRAAAAALPPRRQLGRRLIQDSSRSSTSHLVISLTRELPK